MKLILSKNHSFSISKSYLWDMDIAKRLQSFKHAKNGFLKLLSTEKNFKIHIALTIFTITLAFFLEINKAEWIWIILCIGAVLSAEALNTSIELICNKIEPNYCHLVKSVKDIAAFAVLVLAITSLIIGTIVFSPKIYTLMF